ncbi:MAG: RNA 3'-terminal phosphate cyclase [Candidatus Bathyarchaeota archaeon]|nr:RNA 3'-terminal phosphate cyclase [Candidatus Bathyarchaeota archaeon]
MIEIDGSMMEGGGQILRMALSYGALLGVPTRVYNIRQGRSRPGLRPQHLKTAETLTRMCGGEADGLRIGSPEVGLRPGSIPGGNYKVDIGTAGSITLMLQCLAPIAAFSGAPMKLVIRGGTNVKWSPPTPFMDNVTWAALRSMGFQGSLSVQREGFYPKGGGLVTAEFNPVESLTPLIADGGRVSAARGVSICGRLPGHVAERQGRAAEARLGEEGIDADIDVRVESGRKSPLSPGSVICLWASGSPGVFMGSSSLGERGKPAERVGEEAAGALLGEVGSGAAVDRYTGDNLILWCSLASGESDFTVSELTTHTETAVELARIFTGADIRVEAAKNGARIRINGIGLRNLHLG